MTRDVRIAGIAVEQFGVFTRAQAIAGGFTARMIQHRLETGAWIMLHPAVYALAGTPATWERDQLAACYWSRGPAAGLSAGYLHGLPGFDKRTLEVVTRDRRRAMPRCGIVVHCTNRLPAEQVVDIRGIPATSIERTLFDLCARVSQRDAAIAVDNALSRGLTTIGLLDHCLYRTARRGRKGCARLRELVVKRASLGKFPTSPLETVVFEMLVESGLPLPEIQQPLYDSQGRFLARPDFIYPDVRLVIEAHSRLWHEGAEARASDAERDERLRAADYDVLYVTWIDATQYRERTLGLIRRFLEEPHSELRASHRSQLLLS